MEEETRLSADHFEECLREASFTEMDTASGLLFAIRKGSVPFEKRFINV
jgi:hypothetical protein